MVTDDATREGVRCGWFFSGSSAFALALWLLRCTSGARPERLSSVLRTLCRPALSRRPHGFSFERVNPLSATGEERELALSN